MRFRAHYGHLQSHTSSRLRVNREEHTLLLFNSCYLEVDSSSWLEAPTETMYSLYLKKNPVMSSSYVKMRVKQWKKLPREVVDTPCLLL